MNSCGYYGSMLVKYGAMTDVYGDWYGLDFGTSNTAVSVFKNGEAFSLPIDQYNDEKEILLSAICFFKSKQYYGREAIDLYLKEISHREKTEKDLEIRLIRSFKSLLSREVETKTVIEGKILTIEDIVSSYFIELKRRSDSIVGKDIKKIIVGRPVRFVGQKDADGFQAEKKIENCLKRAGFSEVKFEYEPVVIIYKQDGSTNPSVIIRGIKSKRVGIVDYVDFADLENKLPAMVAKAAGKIKVRFNLVMRASDYSFVEREAKRKGLSKTGYLLGMIKKARKESI